MYSSLEISKEEIQLIKSGDLEKFKSVFLKFWNPLIHFSYRFVKDKDIAEDLVQDTFMQIWSNLSEINTEKNFKTYLFTAVKNRSLNHLRHSNIIADSHEFLKLHISETSSPDKTFDENELAEVITTAISKLPERCRLIFTMNRFDHLTYKEIAAILNISIKTVETQMSRALKFLRANLSRYIFSIFI